ncbi:MAG TPA: tyrosine--tRNA ligase [bacterium]
MPTDALQVIKRGASEIISEPELLELLRMNRPLNIKAGFDPTAPDLHLGHTVLLRKLRHFQDLGHKVLFLIGDATGLVGDPSGQSQTRPVLSWEDVRANAATYKQQVERILLTDPAHFEIRYNSEWFFGRSPQMRAHGLEHFDFMQFVQLASRATVARLIERDDFARRLSSGKPVSVLELFYPLMQGYDSVKLAEQHGSCDVELGGTDQTFNLLMGRELLRAFGHRPQVVLTMPLLEGTDGVQKMSKSLGNHVGIDDAPGEMFGKLMSIPDPLITKYFTLLTDTETQWVRETARAIETRAVNPRDAKLDLAETLVRMYHRADAAASARAEFLKVFSRREAPTEMPEVVVRPGKDGMVSLVELIVQEGVASTKNEARRLIKQGAVRLDGRTVTTPTVPVAGATGVLQVGPRHFRRLKPDSSS